MINNTLITGILLSGMIFLTVESFAAPVGDGGVTSYAYSYDGAGNCTARNRTQNSPLQGPPAEERLSGPEIDLNIRIARSLIRLEQKARRVEQKAARASRSERKTENKQSNNEEYHGTE